MYNDTEFLQVLEEWYKENTIENQANLQLPLKRKRE